MEPKGTVLFDAKLNDPNASSDAKRNDPFASNRTVPFGPLFAFPQIIAFICES